MFQLLSKTQDLRILWLLKNPVMLLLRIWTMFLNLSPQHECQNLASKDSELNVTEGDDHSNCDSESESTTEGESDENSFECER